MAVRDYVAKYVADLTGYRLTPAIRQTEQLEKATDNTADAVVRDWQRMERGADRAARGIAADATRAGHEGRKAFGEAGKEAGAEFAQNLGESISSGDIGGLVSGTVGGLAGTFGAAGPIGLAVAGLGAAAVAVFQGISAGAEKSAQAVADAFEGILSNESQAEALTRVLEERWGTRAEGIAELGKAADRLGVPLKTITDALTEGGDEAETLRRKLEQVISTSAMPGTSAQELGEMRSTARDLLGYLGDVTTEHDKAAAAARRWAGVITDPKVLSAAQALAGYGRGSSTYASQVPRYTGGKRQ